MKKILIASTVLAGAIAYLILKRNNKSSQVSTSSSYEPRKRHFTKLFANAKSAMG